MNQIKKQPINRFNLAMVCVFSLVFTMVVYELMLGEQVILIAVVTLVIPAIFSIRLYRITKEPMPASWKAWLAEILRVSFAPTTLVLSALAIVQLPVESKPGIPVYLFAIALGAAVFALFEVIPILWHQWRGTQAKPWNVKKLYWDVLVDPLFYGLAVFLKRDYSYPQTQPYIGAIIGVTIVWAVLMAYLTKDQEA
ncbi:MAG TPA: hypothetical protein VNG90_04850 [Candidatus Acidoferrum sp.]|nr:hypothetical protein [Candidatus Acidoferrum sp.]